MPGVKGATRGQRRVLLLAVLVPFLGLVAGGLTVAARLVLYRPANAAGAPADGRPRALVISHVHTTASDGKGTVAEVAEAARASGVDALLVTDHDAALPAAPPSYVAGVLVIVGRELNSDDGHIVALGEVAAVAEAYPPSFETAEAVADVQRRSGLAIAAHPTRRNPDSIAWTAPLDAVDGLEVVNLDAAWRERVSPWRLLGAFLARPMAPELVVAAAVFSEPRARELLDAEQRRRPLLALAGSDAHGQPDGYRSSFDALANVVLLDRPLAGDAAGDAALVLEALRRRRVLVAFRALADPRAASFLGMAGGETLLPGEVWPRDPAGADTAASVELRLESGLDRDADLRILHDGKVTARARGKELALKAEARGAYRAEVWLDGPFAVPFLLSNAIFLGAPEGPATPSPEPCDGFGRSLLAALQPEHDPGSAIALETDAGGARAPFRLGQADPATGRAWVALVAREPFDLSRHARVLVVASADPELRLDAVVAVGPDGGRTRYRRSLRLTREARAFCLPLSSFRGMAESGERLPAGGEALAVQLVLHERNALPGTAGEIRVQEVRLE